MAISLKKRKQIKMAKLGTHEKMILQNAPDVAIKNGFINSIILLKVVHQKLIL